MSVLCSSEMRGPCCLRVDGPSRLRPARKPRATLERTEERVMLKNLSATIKRALGTALKKKKQQRPSRHQFIPALEHLQERLVPTSTIINGVLYIDGTNAGDHV